MDIPLAITIPEAVKTSGLSRSSLYEALRKGELEARKAGRRTLITVDALRAYLDGLPIYKAEASK